MPSSLQHPGSAPVIAIGVFLFNKSIPYKTKEIKEWFKENRDKMNDIDLKVEYGEIIDVFFLNINSKKNINLNN